MSLPSAEEVVQGAAVEDSETGLFVYKETEGGDLEAVCHTWRTTLEDVASQISMENTEAIVIDHASGTEHERIRVPTSQTNAEPSREEETVSEPARSTTSTIEQARASGESATYELMVDQLERMTGRAEELQKRLDDVRDRYRKKIDQLEKEHEEEREELRERIEDLEDEKRDLRSDMSATERVAQMAAPKVPALLGALTQKLAGPKGQAAQDQNTKEAQAEAIAAETKQVDSGEETKKLEEGERGEEFERRVQEESQKRLMQTQTVGVLNGYITGDIPEAKMKSMLERFDDTYGLPSDVERLVKTAGFIKDNLDAYRDQLEGMDEHDAAETLSMAAEGEVTQEEKDLLASLIGSLKDD